MSTAMVSALGTVPYNELTWQGPGTGTAPPVLRVPVRLAPVVQQLQKLATLQSGWNSYQGQALTHLAVSQVVVFLATVDWGGPLPNVVPTAPGGVKLEWGDDESGVEVEVGADGTFAALIDDNGEMEEYSLTGPRDPRWAEILRWAEKLA